TSRRSAARCTRSLAWRCAGFLLDLLRERSCRGTAARPRAPAREAWSWDFSIQVDCWKGTRATPHGVARLSGLHGTATASGGALHLRPDAFLAMQRVEGSVERLELRERLRDLAHLAPLLPGECLP